MINIVTMNEAILAHMLPLITNGGNAFMLP